MHKKSQRGFSDITMILALSALSAVLVSGMMNWTSERIKVSVKKELSDLEKLYVSSGADTFLQAFRAAERIYLRSTSACSSARPFIQALAEGSGCAMTIQLFNSSPAIPDPGMNVLYTYPSGGCRIVQNSSNCIHATRVLVSIGHAQAQQRISGNSFQFSLIKVWPGGRFAQFQVRRQFEGNTREYNLAIKNYFSNAAHLDSDLTVVQETPDPLALCPGTPWGIYQVFNRETNICDTFSQPGGGTGLAFYRGRFFGFRPSDGIIIDLYAATTQTTYIVNHTTGRVGSETRPSFVPYPNPNNPTQSLMNIDDITMIDNQMYYVALSGTDAHIGHVSTNGTRTILCQVGAMGWAQSYSGIAAASWSDPLISDPSNPLNSYLQNRFALFFLKTDAGDLLTANVERSGGSFTCSVSKDQNLQQVEFSRTLGFDRTQDERPYYVF